jgi:hypothetical protein
MTVSAKKESQLDHKSDLMDKEEAAACAACAKEMSVCFDPVTGDISIIDIDGKCKPGWVKKLAEKAAKRGVTFVAPKIHYRESE